ncbi:MAG TPA: hypothetical protein VKQ72_14870 [Aggregatilineales bacterium]|nr:hypothetical protein [Aggregatilineales bacterium]
MQHSMTQNSDRHSLPTTIHLNVRDRNYIIPETDDPDGLYFPMSLVIGLTLKVALKPEQLIAAVVEVDRRFPQFRLGYRLDYRNDFWYKVPDGELQEHLKAMVRHGKAAALDDLMSASLPANIVPISQPLEFTLHGNNLVVKAIHAFGDGRFIMQLIAYILQAVLEPAIFERLPALPAHTGIPLWRVVWQSPGQGIGILLTAAKLLGQTYQDFKTTPVAGDAHKVFPVIHSGSPMQVVRFTLTAQAMTLLDEIRNSIQGPNRISLNTLMQVLIAHGLADFGSSVQPTIYTIPVDLKRYLKQPDTFYPGNLASQIRVRQAVRESFDLAEEAAALQQEIERQLADRSPLASLPMEWLFALGGKKLFRKTNRDWLLNSPKTDPRFFVLTNLGSLDTDWKALLPHMEGTCGFAVPLMGAPPVVVAFLALGGVGHLTLVYNPLALSAEQAQMLLTTFGPERLNSLLDTLNDHGSHP